MKVGRLYRVGRTREQDGHVPTLTCGYVVLSLVSGVFRYVRINQLLKTCADGAEKAKTVAEIVIENNNLVVKLTTGEKFMALRLNDVVVPLDQITAVRAVGSVRSELRGLRVPGFEVFGRKVGTWRTTKAQDFVYTANYNEGTVIELTGHKFDRIVTTLAVPAALAEGTAA